MTVMTIGCLHNGQLFYRTTIDTTVEHMCRFWHYKINSCDNGQSVVWTMVNYFRLIAYTTIE